MYLRYGTVLLAASINAYSWSASGTVKDKSTGAALSGVAVTVKDSSKYSATTDSDGKFRIGSTVGVVKSHSFATGSYSLKVNNNMLSHYRSKERKAGTRDVQL